MGSIIHYCPNFAAEDIWTSGLIVVEVCRTSFKKCSSDVQCKYSSNISCDFPWMISEDQTQQMLMSILLVRRKLPEMDKVDRRTSPSDYKHTTLLICSVTQSICEWCFDFRFVLMGSWTYGDVSKSYFVIGGLPKDFVLKTTNATTIVSQWTSRYRYGRPGSRWITQSQRRVIGAVVQGVVQRLLINPCQEFNTSLFESQSCIILALHPFSPTYTQYTPSDMFDIWMQSLYFVTHPIQAVISTLLPPTSPAVHQTFVTGNSIVELSWLWVTQVWHQDHVDGLQSSKSIIPKIKKEVESKEAIAQPDVQFSSLETQTPMKIIAWTPPKSQNIILVEQYKMAIPKIAQTCWYPEAVIDDRWEVESIVALGCDFTKKTRTSTVALHQMDWLALERSFMDSIF